MAEFSMMPWETQTGTGDGQFSYTQDQASQFFRDFHNSSVATSGVLSGIDNELAVSGSTSPLSVATGKGYSYARYWNDAVANVVVTTPLVGDTGFRVVLRTTWATNQTRLAVLRSADGNNAIPALTQTAGTTWEISLASGVIDLAGNIWRTAAKTEAGVTDTRAFVISPGAAWTRLRVFEPTGNSFIDWRDIQQDLKHLRIIGQLRDSTGAASVQLYGRFNASAAAVYDSMEVDTDPATPVTVTQTLGATQFQLGRIVGNGGGANRVSLIDLLIPYYAQATTYKNLSGNVERPATNAYHISATFLSTAAISRIQISSSIGFASTLIANLSKVTLYGIR